MKKKGFIAGLFLLLLMCTVLPVSAAQSGERGVFDTYGVLDQKEEQKFSEIIEDIYHQYHFGIALVVSEDIDGDERQYAARFMQTKNIGYGDTKEGLCIFHQPDARNLAIVFRGQAKDQFSSRIQDRILDHAIPLLKEEDFSGAYETLLLDVEKGLSILAQGKELRPMDFSQTGWQAYLGKWGLISLLIMAIPTGLMVWYQGSKMKTQRPMEDADFYLVEDQVEITRREDRYLRTITSRTKIEDTSKNNDSGGFSSGGESFSGSSRDY